MDYQTLAERFRFSLNEIHRQYKNPNKHVQDGYYDIEQFEKDLKKHVKKNTNDIKDQSAKDCLNYFITHYEACEELERYGLGMLKQFKLAMGSGDNNNRMETIFRTNHSFISLISNTGVDIENLVKLSYNKPGVYDLLANYNQNAQQLFQRGFSLKFLVGIAEQDTGLSMLEAILNNTPRLLSVEVVKNNLVVLQQYLKHTTAANVQKALEGEDIDLEKVLEQTDKKLRKKMSEAGAAALDEVLPLPTDVNKLIAEEVINNSGSRGVKSLGCLTRGSRLSFTRNILEQQSTTPSHRLG